MARVWIDDAPLSRAARAAYMVPLKSISRKSLQSDETADRLDLTALLSS